MRLAKSGELKAFRIRKTSHTRIRMNQAVYRDTPQRAADSLSVSRSAMHSANAIQVSAGSFESASRPPVLRENVLPHLLPKGTSLELMDAMTLAEICCHVNSTVRKGCGDVSPMQLAELVFPKEMMGNLGLRLIPPRDVISAPGILYEPEE